MAAGYTRVTLVGSQRRVDVVLPSAEPVGRLLPEALRVTAEPATDPPRLRSLATLDGRVLDSDESLGDADVPDGAVLRVVGLAEAPPPPVVLDITEEVTDELAQRSLLWGPGARQWVCAATASAAAVLVVHVMAPRLDDPALTTLAVAVAAGLLLLGAIVARAVAASAGTACILAGATVGLYAAVLLPDTIGLVTGAVAGVSAVTAVVLGLATTLGRGGIVGGGIGLLLLALWAGVERTLPLDQSATVLAVVSLLLIGVLPRAALVLSGLTALDDARARDETVGRRDVVTAIAAAHRGLALATVAAAVSAAVAGLLLARDGGRWTIPLAVLLTVALGIRTRSFPLVSEVVALLTAGAVVLGGLTAAWLRAEPDAALIVAGLLAAAVALAVIRPLLRPAEPLLARARRLTDRVEALTIVAALPVAVGVSGVYGQLLRSF